MNAAANTASPLTLHIADEVLDDPRERLARTRWPDQPPGSGRRDRHARLRDAGRRRARCHTSGQGQGVLARTRARARVRFDLAAGRLGRRFNSIRTILATGMTAAGDCIADWLADTLRMPASSRPDAVETV